MIPVTAGFGGPSAGTRNGTIRSVRFDQIVRLVPLVIPVVFRSTAIHAAEDIGRVFRVHVRFVICLTATTVAHKRHVIPFISVAETIHRVPLIP